MTHKLISLHPNCNSDGGFAYYGQVCYDCRLSRKCSVLADIRCALGWRWVCRAEPGVPIEPRPSCPQQCLDQTLVRPQAQAQHACSNMNMKFCNSIIFISVTIVYSSNNNEVTECPSVNCNPSFAPPSKRPHAMMPMRSSSIVAHLSLSPSNLNFSTKQRSSGMTCTAAHRLSDQRRLRLFKGFSSFLPPGRHKFCLDYLKTAFLFSSGCLFFSDL